MTQININPPQFRYEVYTYTICQGWINCWTFTDSCDTTLVASYESVEEAQAEIDEMDDPEEHRIYDNVAKEYVVKTDAWAS